MGDRTAVVTGGGRGIGRGIVLALASKGLAVVVNYRGDQASAEDTCAMAKDAGAPEAIAVRADIADVEQGQALIDRTLERFGRLDVLVNNAGVAPERRADVLELTIESWDRVLGINLRGPFQLSQIAAKAMIDRREGWGSTPPSIVFVTSISSVFASVNRAEYCVSKAALSMVAQLFAVRLADEGIRVYEVRPGVIETDMTAPVRESYDQRIADGLAPIRRWGRPEDVGNAVAVLASGAIDYATGQILYIDGGLHLRSL